LENEQLHDEISLLFGGIGELISIDFFCGSARGAPPF